MTLYRLLRLNSDASGSQDTLHERLLEIKAHLLSFAEQVQAAEGGFHGDPRQQMTPLAMPKVSAFERSYRVALPADYRAFLTEVANGCLGPGNGLLPLDRALRDQRMIVPLHLLRTPFPHQTAYNPNEDPTWQALLAAQTRGEVTAAEVASASLYQAAGTLTLCRDDHGHTHRLVVSGPTAGEVWVDATAHGDGYVPLGVSFLTWYKRWLGAVLAERSGAWWRN